MKGHRLSSCAATTVLGRRTNSSTTIVWTQKETKIKRARNSGRVFSTVLGGANISGRHRGSNLAMLPIRRVLHDSSTSSTGNATTLSSLQSQDPRSQTESTWNAAAVSITETKRTLEILQEGTVPTLIVLGGAAAVLTLVGLWNRYKDNQEKFWNIVEESTQKERQSHQLQLRINPSPSAVDDIVDEHNENSAAVEYTETEDGEWLVISQQSNEAEVAAAAESSESLTTPGHTPEAYSEPTIVFHRNSAAFLRVSDLNMDESTHHRYADNKPTNEKSETSTERSEHGVEEVAVVAVFDNHQQTVDEPNLNNDNEETKVDSRDDDSHELAMKHSNQQHDHHPMESIYGAEASANRVDATPPRPNFDHVAVDPPEGVEPDDKERWIALTSGQQNEAPPCHSPVAPAAIQALAEYALECTYDSDLWAIASNATTRALSQSPKWNDIVWQKDGIIDQLPSDTTSSSTVMVWSGTFQHGKYGFDLPAIRSAGIVDMNPKALLDLLVDSSRVKEYNKMSVYRDDILVLQDDDSQPLSTKEALTRSIENKQQQTQESYFEEEIEQGHTDNASSNHTANTSTIPTNNSENNIFGGATKIMKSESRLPPPLSSTTLQFTTLLHARELEDGSGYELVTRAVTLPESTNVAETGEPQTPIHSIFSNSGGGRKLKSEILLGVTILKKVKDDEKRCFFLAVNHIRSPMIPVRIARPIGTTAAINFVSDLRAAAAKAATSAVEKTTTIASEETTADEAPQSDAESQSTTPSATPEEEDKRFDPTNEGNGTNNSDNITTVCVDADVDDHYDDHDELDSY